MNKFLFPLIITIWLLQGCGAPVGGTQAKYQLLDSLTNHSISESTKALLVISDQNCLSCNNKFAALIDEYANNPGYRIIISANENMVDLSPFIGKMNVYHDDAKMLASRNVITSSAVFFLKQRSIDTIVEISANNFNATVSYLMSRLGQ